MNTATIVTTYKNAAGATTVKSEIISGTVEVNLESDPIPGASSAVLFPSMAIDISRLAGFALGCKKTTGTPIAPNEGTAQLVVKTYLATVLKDTFTITPSNGLGWTPADPTTNPLTSDFDEIRVDNVAVSASSGAVAKMEISGRFLMI